MVDHEGLTGPQASENAFDGLSRVHAGHDTSGTPQGLPVRIPRIIHRIWLDQMLPEPFAAWGRDWRDLNDGWEIFDWGDSAALRELPLRRQDLRDRAKEIIPNDWRRFQADILRLELLYEFGGVYVDMDVEPHHPIEPLIFDHDVLVARSRNATSTGYHAVTNCFMASVPKHPWIGHLLDTLDEAIHRYRGKPLAQMVGPWHLDRMLREGSWEDVDVVDWDTVSVYFTHFWNNQRRKRGEGIA